jgi:sulfate transport system permease protein
VLSQDARGVRLLLTFVALAFLALFLVLPLVAVMVEAFAQGFGTYAEVLGSPDTRSAMDLTLFVCCVCVPVNVLFGLAAAWCIAKFDFPGRSLLIALLDLPLSVSPVIAGLLFVLLFGAQGLFGPLLAAHGLRVIFAVPGVLLATLFVTSPFVAKELIPLMEAQGSDEELAAISLGASGWQTFWRVTLPNVKWGLLYGVILCTARALGEFGAVSVVSGHIRGQTNTVPLQIQSLYDESNTAAAFAVASLLTLLALVTLAVKAVVEHKGRAALDAATAGHGIGGGVRDAAAGSGEGGHRGR